eukprot:gene11946-15943_t
MLLSSGPMLFVPETFYQFCALVELVGGRTNAKVSKTLCEMEAFIRSTQQKTVQWGTAPHAFANNLAASRPAAFGAFTNFKFVQQPPPQPKQQPQRQPRPQPQRQPRPQQPRAFNAGNAGRRQGNGVYYAGGNDNYNHRNNHHHHNHHHNDNNNPNNPNNNTGAATSTDPVNTNTDINAGNTPSDAPINTDSGIDGDGDGNLPTDIDNADTDNIDGAPADADDAVDMYGGCGPRDLPDGYDGHGDGHGPCAVAPQHFRWPNQGSIDSTP